MLHVKRSVCAIALSGLLTLAVVGAEPLLRPGDRLFFLGDGIALQHVYTRYVMNTFVSRYPDMTVGFRNAGLVGDGQCDRTPGGFIRLQRDVLGLDPTWVCVAMGMNDPRYKAFDQAAYDEFITGLTNIVAAVKQSKVRVLLMTPGCVDLSFRRNGIDGKTYNEVLRRYGEGVKDVAAREHLPVADVHAVMAAMLEKNPAQVFGEPAQPSAVTHAAMAFAIARALGCEGPVSDVVMDGKAGRLGRATGCKVSQLKVTSNTVSFVRADKAIPAYLDPEAQGIYSCVPEAAQLNRYGLTVKGLAEGSWQLAVEGTNVAVFTAAKLAEGINLSCFPGPWHTLGARINGMNAGIEELYSHFWWDVVTACNWWLPTEAEPERKVLEKKMLQVLANRDKAVYQVAREMKPWRWTLTRQCGEGEPKLPR